MKILLCHNYYQQIGGEDFSFADERRMLLKRGHEVIEYTRHNDEIKELGRAELARQTIWSRRSYRELRELIRSERPDLMHCTNTFPLISPAAYDAARAEGVPVVQALRNYRLLCPAAILMRDNKACESCMTTAVPWPAIRYGCYRDSRAASAVVAGMLTWHRLRGTWQRNVDAFFSLTQFARGKFVEGGLPADRLFVKPNCIDPDPGMGDGKGGYAIFVGRLAAGKGIETLLDAWSQFGDLPLKVVGDGPQADMVRDASQRMPQVQWCGPRSHTDVLDLIGGATMLVMPSRWYETFGRTIIEAYAKGTPVIASNLGAMADLVDPKVTGLLFEPGNATKLADCVRNLLGSDLNLMRQQARAAYEEKFTADKSYAALMKIYDHALGRSRPVTQTTELNRSLKFQG